jgi:hypothetical protein
VGNPIADERAIVDALMRPEVSSVIAAAIGGTGVTSVTGAGGTVAAPSTGAVTVTSPGVGLAGDIAPLAAAAAAGASGRYADAAHAHVGISSLSSGAGIRITGPPPSLTVVNTGVTSVSLNGGVPLVGDISISALTNPMTTVGDLILGGAAGAPARLAAGTAGQILSMVGGSPAWAATSGGAPLAVLYYTGTQAYTTTSNTPVAIDAANLLVTFTVPASGKVLVTATACVAGAFSNTNVVWGVGTSQTAFLQSQRMVNGGTANTALIEVRLTSIFYLTGLTPGASVTLYWLWDIPSTGTAFMNTDAGGTGNYGPAIMVVQAA